MALVMCFTIASPVAPAMVMASEEVTPYYEVVHKLSTRMTKNPFQISASISMELPNDDYKVDFTVKMYKSTNGKYFTHADTHKETKTGEFINFKSTITGVSGLYYKATTTAVVYDLYGNYIETLEMTSSSIRF